MCSDKNLVLLARAPIFEQIQSDQSNTLKTKITRACIIQRARRYGQSMRDLVSKEQEFQGFQ